MTLLFHPLGCLLDEVFVKRVHEHPPTRKKLPSDVQAHAAHSQSNDRAAGTDKTIAYLCSTACKTSMLSLDPDSNSLDFDASSAHKAGLVDRPQVQNYLLCNVITN